MAYVNDAQTLADVVSPAAAAAQMGIQNDDANQAAQIKNVTDQGQQAAEIARPGLQNLFTQAQTANESALGQQAQQTADIGAATMPGTIAAKNAANQTAVNADNVKQVGQLGMIAGQVAGIMDNVPQAARPAAMQQIAQQYGIDPQKLGPLMSGDPDTLRQVASKAIQASSDYQTEQMKETMHNQGSADVASITSEGRVTASENAANARITASKIAQQTRESALNFEQMAVRARERGDIQGANEYAAQAQRMHQLSAETTATLLNQNPMTPAFTGGGNSPAPSAPQGQAPAGPPDANAVEAEMRRRGLLK